MDIFHIRESIIVYKEGDCWIEKSAEYNEFTSLEFQEVSSIQFIRMKMPAEWLMRLKINRSKKDIEAAVKELNGSEK